MRTLMEDILGEKDHTNISVMATFREQITNAPPVRFVQEVKNN